MKTTKNLWSTIVSGLLVLTLITGCSKSSEQGNTKSENNNLKAASNSGEKLNLVSSESKLEWIGKKVTGQHNGTVEIVNGGLFLDNDKLTGGSFDIDFRTTKVLDIEDPESNAKLTSHLKSPDFFAAETFPIGKFEILSLAPLSDGSQNNYTVSGNLSIKDITKEIQFPANVKVNGGSVIASGDFNIDRTLWDINFRSGKFYENLGDKLINDNINLKFNITAKQL